MEIQQNSKYYFFFLLFFYIFFKIIFYYFIAFLFILFIFLKSILFRNMYKNLNHDRPHRFWKIVYIYESFICTVKHSKQQDLFPNIVPTSPSSLSFFLPSYPSLLLLFPPPPLPIYTVMY